MGYIREPKGVDFTIGELQMTDADRVAIREAIAASKAAAKKVAQKKPLVTRKSAAKRAA